MSRERSPSPAHAEISDFSEDKPSSDAREEVINQTTTATKNQQPPLADAPLKKFPRFASAPPESLPPAPPDALSVHRWSTAGPIDTDNLPAASPALRRKAAQLVRAAAYVYFSSSVPRSFFSPNNFLFLHLALEKFDTIPSPRLRV